MDANFACQRRRPSEPAAHLLIALVATMTLAGVAGSACGLQHASALLYWPVALVVAATAVSFRRARGAGA